MVNALATLLFPSPCAPYKTVTDVQSNRDTGGGEGGKVTHLSSNWHKSRQTCPMLPQSFEAPRVNLPLFLHLLCLLPGILFTPECLSRCPPSVWSMLDSLLALSLFLADTNAVLLHPT